MATQPTIKDKREKSHLSIDHTLSSIRLLIFRVIFFYVLRHVLRYSLRLQ